jgi:hypothetical protein
MEVFVRRRIGIAGVAVAALSLIVGVGFAFAAGQKHHKHAKPAKPRPVLLSCSSSPTTVPPAGQANVDQPPAGGNQYGPATCKTTGFGSGIISDTFTVPDSGDMVGTYTEYFDAGTIKGTFDLSPGEGQPIGSDTFASQSWSGQVTVTGGTGIYQGIKGKDTKGTMSCNSPDSVHSTCTENVMILIPPPASTTTGSATGSASKRG